MAQAAAQLAEALRGFDFQWCHWNYSLTSSFWPHIGSGVDSAFNKNEYQEYILRDKGGRCVGLTALSTSCADCLEIWSLFLLNPQGLSRPARGLLARYTNN
jgi:hypothetical protein